MSQKNIGSDKINDDILGRGLEEENEENEKEVDGNEVCFRAPIKSIIFSVPDGPLILCICS